VNRAYGFLVRAYMGATRQLVCKQAVALMSDYLDGRLPERDARRLERHLRGCPHCSEYLAQLRATIDALGAASPDDLSDDLVDELVGLYREWQADPD
jgi:anti-sigma factor RsiW